MHTTKRSLTSLIAMASIAAGMVGVNAFSAAASSFGSDGVELIPVEVSSTTPGKVDFTWTVKTNKPVTFKYMQLATVGQAGTGFHNNAVVNGTRTFTATQSLPNGTRQTTRPVYMINNTWVNGPAVTYTVGSTAPKPAPAPESGDTTTVVTPTDPDSPTLHMEWRSTGLRKVSYNSDGVALAPVRVGVDGGKVTYDWTVATRTSTTFQDLQVAVRDAAGNHLDVGKSPGTVLDGLGQNTTSGALPGGKYTAWVAYRLPGGGWVEGPKTSFSVPGTGTPAPTPTPEPKPEPAPEVSYDANGVNLTSPKATVAADGTVTFNWDVRTSRSVSFTHLQLATAGQAGAGFNNNVTVNGARSFSAKQKLAPGSYKTAVVYLLNGKWVNGPQVSFTVGSPAPAPAPAPTPAPAPKPTDPGGTTSSAPMKLPAKVVGGYWMKWSNSRSVRLANVDQRYNVIYLSFAQGRSGTGALHFNQGAQSQAQFTQDVATVRARGQRVIMSIGGEGGHIDLSSQQRRQQMLDSLIQMRENEVVFDGIDWDIEQAVIDADGMHWVSMQLKQRYGQNFAITAAPQGHRVEYKQFAQRMGSNLDFIGIQYYDYSEPSQASRCNSVQHRTNELINNYQVDPSRIGIGNRVQDYSERYVGDSGASNWWSVNGAKNCWNTMEAKYPSLRGAYVWELSMDNRAGGRWINEVGAAVAN